MRSVLVLGAVLTALVVMPAAADAADQCVNKTGTDGCYMTVGGAVGAANDGDTIRIGPGSYGESILVGKRLAFVGAGAGPIGGTPDDATDTTIVAPPRMAGPGTAALSLPSGGSVRGIRLIGGGTPGANVMEVPGPGIQFAPPSGDQTYALTDVVAIGGEMGQYQSAGVDVAPAAGATATVAISGGWLRSKSNGGQGLDLRADGARVSVTGARLEGSFYGAAVAAKAATLAIDRSDVRGGLATDGQGGSITVRRSTIDGILRITANGSGTFARGLLVDSTVVSRPVVPGAALTTGVFVRGTGGDALLETRGSTIVAVADPAGQGYGVWSFGGNTPGVDRVRVVLHDTAVRVIGAGEELHSAYATGDIAADHSAFARAGAQDGGQVPAVGSPTNVGGDPGFVSADPASLDLRPAPGSPLVDVDDPSLVEPGELDLAGSPRALDGNADCAAVPDIGAYELTGAGAPCPTTPPIIGIPSGTGPIANAAPSVSAFKATRKRFSPKARRKAKRGTAFTFRLSEAATVRIAITRARPGRKAKGARCVRPTRKLRKAKRCTRHVPVGTVKAKGKAGANRVAFSGRFKRKALPRGRYRATLVATDPQGARSRARRISLRVVRP